MCTASWRQHDNSYHLFFNRDELISRAPAIPPTIHKINKTHVLMPVDPEGLGSWISVNQFGMGLCLLNNYSAPVNQESRNWMSRGQLVKSLCHLNSISTLQQSLVKYPLHVTKGFQLLAIFPQHNIIASWIWDGVNLEQVSLGQSTFSSSAFGLQPVISTRIQVIDHDQWFKDEVISIETHRQFHRQTNDIDGSHGVCMHTNDRKTVSYTEIYVSHNEISMGYIDDRPSLHPNIITHISLGK